MKNFQFRTTPARRYRPAAGGAKLKTSTSKGECLPVPLQAIRRPAAAVLGLTLCLGGWAATPIVEDAEQAGRRLALHGDEAVRCARCHGPLGQGDAPAGVPRLAGQSRFYLHKQLDDFAAGTRPSDKMQPIARALSDQQREQAAAYYASLRDVPYPPRPAADPWLLQQGGALSGGGAAARNVRACVLCHAVAGSGYPPSFPYLAGQHAGYTARQMQLWKQGLRRNDPLDVMGEIARNLSDDEIRGLALYFARVRLPPEIISDLTPGEEP